MGLRSAIAEIDVLLGRQSRSKAESERLDQLSEAVRAYEQRRFPVPPLSPAERLRHLLDIHGMDTQQLAAATGVKRSVLEEVLKGTGKFKEADARRLADHYSLELTAFLNAQ